jgi:putative flippase GtrA
MPEGERSRSQIARQALRYGIVTGAGFVVDLSLLWVLAVALDVPLAPAAAIAVVAAGALNYVLHELWTFRSGAARPSLTARRASKFAAVVVTTALVRSSVIALAAATTNLDPLGRVILAIVASYLVGFTLSRTLVFEKKRMVSG